jgi:2-polyprenyl-3-methyl-5-hydroxy-6-metoxy-1,4-benzoquinol methylase
LCGGRRLRTLDVSVRDNQDLRVVCCQQCGLQFLSSFDHVDEGVYRASGMHRNAADIKQWMKSTLEDDQRRFGEYRQLISNKKVLDFGCGNGGFLKLAKENAASVQGLDLEEALYAHFHDLEIPFCSCLDRIDEKFDIITLFHVLEHLPDPAAVLMKLKHLLNPGGRMIIEVPNANDALLTLYRSEAFNKFAYWSFHLFIFDAQTLKQLFSKASVELLYLKHIQRYPLSNHFYWLARKEPEGHRHWDFLNSGNLARAYENQLAALGMTDTLSAGICGRDK